VNYEVDADYESHMDLIKKCILTISDDGYGFPESEIDKAFDKFYRLQNSKTGGTGLGLSIVKGFVEAQHGVITLHNAESGGAVFEMIFEVDCLSTKTVENEF
jgi:two-component system sensor histidine kinase KdpD